MGGICKVDGKPMWNQYGSTPVGESTWQPQSPLKSIPEEVYDRLKWSAQAHRRSINSEAIVCLESVLVPARVRPADRLAQIRALREKLTADFLAEDIDAFKRAGRE